MITLKVLSIYKSDEVCRQVEKAAGAIEGVNISSRSNNLKGTLADIGVTEQPDVLIIELDNNGAVVEAIESELARICKTTAVLVTQENGDVTVMRTLMRLGIRDFIPQPVNKQDLVNVLTEVLSEKRRRILDDRGRVASAFVFVNAKGGSGASTLAINTAAMLAARGKLKVALLDFDIQLGTSDLFLDLHSKSTIYDALVQSHRVDAVFLKAMMTKHESGLSVLSSPANLSSIADISAEDVRRILDACAEEYDAVIIDMPNVFTNWSIEILKYAEKVFLVVQNSLSSVRDAKVIVENLPKQGVSLDSIELINNRAEAAMGAVSSGELKETLKIKSVHDVRTDYKAAINSQNQGKLIYEVSPYSKLKKDLDHLTDYIIGMATGKAKKDDKANGEAKGLFSRLRFRN